VPAVYGNSQHVHGRAQCRADLHAGRLGEPGRRVSDEPRLSAGHGRVHREPADPLRPHDRIAVGNLDRPLRTALVFCGFCGQQFGPSFQGPPAVPCTADAQCTIAPFTKGRQRTSGAFSQGPARTITEVGTPAGVCLGDGAAHTSTLVSTFCIPPAFNATVDAAADLPGPGAVALPGDAQFIP